MALPVPKRSLSDATASSIGSQQIAPANDNASSLKKASLKVLQGGGSDTGKKRSDQPVLHPLSQLQLANQLEEDRERDRSSSLDDGSWISDDTLDTSSSDESGPGVLDIEPKSYTTREETPEKSQAQKQREMARTAARMLYPDRSFNEGVSESVAPASEPVSSRGRGSRGSADASLQSDRMAQEGRLASDLATMRAIDALGERGGSERRETKGAQKLQDAQKLERDFARLRSLYIKIAEAGSVVLSILAIILLNIEAFNILLFHKRITGRMGTALSLIGLNIDYDPENPWPISNIVIVSLALLIDLVLVINMIYQFGLWMFVFFLLNETWDLVSMVTGGVLNLSF